MSTQDEPLLDYVHGDHDAPPAEDRYSDEPEEAPDGPPEPRPGRRPAPSGTEARIPPNNLDAELSALGACMLSRSAIEVAVKALVPTDFYKPAHGLIFDAIASLYGEGHPVDPVTIAEVLDRRGSLGLAGGPGALISIQAGTPATSSIARYVNIIAEKASYRKLIAVVTEATEQLYRQEGEPGDIADVIASRLAEGVSGILGAEPSDLWVMDEFLDRPLDQRPQWIIPGLIRQGWRCMLVAPEGVGKTVLFRQIGLAAAQGVHPLHFAPMPPVRTLIVDLENPEDSIHDVCQPIREQTERVSGDYDSDRAWLWHKPGGINLRDRRDRTELENVLAKVRPELVCLGPIYKAYSVVSGENDEQAAKEMMQCFDDLRTRYNFALMLEHHAPKGASKDRDLVPYGSSLWLRWPELGLSLKPTEPGGETLRFGRWRGDRLENSWPLQITRSKPWPWSGTWPAGTFREPGGPKVPTMDDPGMVDGPPPSNDPPPY